MPWTSGALLKASREFAILVGLQDVCCLVGAALVMTTVLVAHANWLGEYIRRDSVHRDPFQSMPAGEQSDSAGDESSAALAGGPSVLGEPPLQSGWME